MSINPNLENRIAKIEERNHRVELDKAWETSTVRKLLIATLTYFVVVSFFLAANLPNPFVNAVVPTIGYLLSTLSVGIIKKIWIRKRKNT